MTQSGYDHRIEQLRRELNSVREHVGNLERGLARSLESLADATLKSAEAITEEVRRNTEVQALQEVAKQEAQLLAVEPIIVEQRNTIGDEVNRFDADQKRMVEKYDRLFRELQESFYRDIRRLGQKIFELVEEAYGAAIETRIKEPTLPDVEAGLIEVVEDRTSAIQAAYQGLGDAADEFVSRRTDFTRGFSQWLAPRKAGTEQPIDVAIPFWIVEVREGEQDQVAVVPRMRLAGDVTGMGSLPSPKSFASWGTGGEPVHAGRELADVLASAAAKVAVCYRLLLQGESGGKLDDAGTEEWRSRLRSTVSAAVRSSIVDDDAAEIVLEHVLHELPPVIRG